MTLYEKNIETLVKYYPQMDVLIENARKNLDAPIEIMEEKSLDGETILKIKKEEQVCYLGGKRNTVEPAQLWVKTVGKLPANSPVFIMGTGDPSYLRELVEKMENRIAIIVYEPSLQIFLKFLEMVDLEKWMEKHLIIFWVKGLEGMDMKSMTAILAKILKCEMLMYSRNFILPNYDVLFAEEAVEYVKACRDVARTELVQFNTMKRFSTVTVKNVLSNARYLCDGYKTTQLIDVIPRDIPGIVVSAGPSLNKNIEELKKAKGKAFIIAVDTAIKPLLKAGIVPDMFAIIDAMKPLDLIKIEGSENIPLVTTLSAASEVLEYHQGMKFFYNEGFEFAEVIFARSKKKWGNLACGGSVATSAFSLLHKIGIRTIILVGQDLAYTNNKSHADGTFKDVMKEEDTSKFMMVEGNYEDKVPTRNDFVIFLDWFNWYIAGCKDKIKEFRVINATEGGAKIQGTEIMTLKEAIESECTKEVNIQECLDKLSPMLDGEKRDWAVNYLRKIPEKLQNLASEARKLKNVYKKLDKICSKKNMDTKEYLSVLKRLEKMIANVEKNELYQLVTVTMSDANYILLNEQFRYEDSVQAEGKEIARKGILYMQSVEKCVNIFEEYVEVVFKDLN